MNARLSTALDQDAIARSIKRIAHEIVERNRGGNNLALLGIVRRGANLAARLASMVKEIEGREAPVGTLDISLYRDDAKAATGDPRLLGRDIPIPLDGNRPALVVYLLIP